MAGYNKQVKLIRSRSFGQPKAVLRTFLVATYLSRYMQIMNKSVFILSLVLAPCLLHAGEWIAVDGGKAEIKIDKKKIEKNLWQYIHKESTIKYEPKDKYTYQYQVINNTELYINAFCYSIGVKDFSQQFVMVLDGGSCFFQVHYNYKTGEYSRLQVNGEA